MKETTTNKLTQNFINKKLTQEELNLFKKKWKENSEFREDVKAYTKLIIALKTADKLNYKDITRQTKIFSLNNFLAAASIIILCFLTIFIFHVIQSPSEKSLAKKHFIDYRLYSLRGYTNNEKSYISEAIKAYNKNDVFKAIDIIKQTKNKDNNTYIFTLADLYLKSNQPDSAIYYYQKGNLHNNADPYAEWNCIMAWLQKGELKIVKRKLTEIISKKQSPYDQKAKILLEKLNSFSFKTKNFLLKLQD